MSLSSCNLLWLVLLALLGLILFAWYFFRRRYSGKPSLAKKIWNDPVGSALISGGILALLPALVAHHYDILPASLILSGLEHPQLMWQQACTSLGFQPVYMGREPGRTDGIATTEEKYQGFRTMLLGYTSGPTFTKYVELGSIKSGPNTNKITKRDGADDPKTTSIGFTISSGYKQSGAVEVFMIQGGTYDGEVSSNSGHRGCGVTDNSCHTESLGFLLPPHF